MNDRDTPVSVLDNETLKEIDLFLEGFYTHSRQAGAEMKNAGLTPSQIRGLETLISSTSRFSEIINFVKNRAGKEKDTKKPWLQVAERLLGQLESLEEKAEELSKNDPGRVLEIKLRLARGWSNQVVSQYLYQNVIDDDEAAENMEKEAVS